MASGAFLFLSRSNLVGGQETSAAGDYVILLHGAGRTSVSMKPLQWQLERRGYRVINVTYPSCRFTVEQLAGIYLQGLIEKKIADPEVKVHFVTHSLGGIILRQYLSNHSLPNLGRVVMLAPPNAGSELVDRWQNCSIGRAFLGASRRELGTRDVDLPRKLGPVRFECGVIAGDRSMNPLLSAQLPSPNDGKVTVERTPVEGMKDFIILHSTHTWLMCRRRTIRQTIRFLTRGSFDHDKCQGAEHVRH